MVRLPIVGSDGNTWGTILNQFLQAGHNTSSGVPIGMLSTFNIKDDAYGAKGDGVTDDTTAIAAARSAANAAGGGIVFWPPGVFITGTQTLYNLVYDIGSGYETTIVKLKNSANSDLFSANTNLINLSAAFGSSSQGGVAQFGFFNITLDGNKANQSSGTSYPLRFYGYGYTMENIRIRNGFSGGVLCDWNGGASSNPFYDNAESMWSNVKIHDNNGIGFEMGGPQSSLFNNFEVFNSGSHNIHIAPNAVTLLINNLVFYGSGQGNSSVGLLLEASQCRINNIDGAGSDTVQVAVLANGLRMNGRLYTNRTNIGTAVQIGQQAGNTPYSGEINQSAGLTTAVAVAGCNLDFSSSNNDGANGTVWFANDSSNWIRADIFNGGTGVPSTGTHSTNTVFQHRNRGLVVPVPLIAEQVNIALSISGSAQTPGTGGTITTNPIFGAVRVNPSGAITGVILQAATIPQQLVLIINESANSITFAASGTSNVAQGTSAVIAALTNRLFVWNSATSLWY